MIIKIQKATGSKSYKQYDCDCVLCLKAKRILELVALHTKATKKEQEELLQLTQELYYGPSPESSGADNNMEKPGAQ